MGRPNILLITMDELNARALGYAGDPTVQTPNIDRLAREGIVFNRAYTTQPICTPARATMWTGQHPANHGVQGNKFTGSEGGLATGTPTFSKALQQQGYETALIGKRHLAVEDESDLGLDHQDLAESKFDFNPPGMTDDYRRWLESEGHSNEEITTWERDGLAEEYRTHYGAIRFPLDEYYYVDSYLGRQFCDWLRRDRDRPFFLWASFCSPHHPWDPPERYDEMYDPADVVLPERRERELHDKPRRQLRYLQELGPGMPHSTRDAEGAVEADEAYDRIPEDVQRKMISRYYGTITLCDDRIGDMLNVLEETGLLDETIILFTSDHGDHLGEHYLWFKGTTMYECLVRVPLVVRLPDGRFAGQERDELVSWFDLAPTFVDWAGARDPGSFDGTSLVPLIEEPATVLHDELYIGTSAVVTRGWKFVRNSGDLDELYNLQADPGELYNLADQEAHVETQRQLEELLERKFPES